MKIAYRLLLFLIISAFLFGCGDKTASIEGKILDGRGQPISGISVIFKQVKPTAGYEQFETKTGPDGIFRLAGLMPASEYGISPLSDKWKTKVSKKITTPPEGENLVLKDPIIVRFNAMKDGTFVDTKTKLQWFIHPFADLNSSNVLSTVRNLKEGGYADWRLPTKEELLGLQDKPAPAKTPAEPVLIQKTCCAWVAEPNSENVDWKFYIEEVNEFWESSKVSPDNRVIIVRAFSAAAATAATPPVKPVAMAPAAQVSSAVAPEKTPDAAAIKTEPGVYRPSRKACAEKKAQSAKASPTAPLPTAPAPSVALPATKTAQPAKVPVPPVKKVDTKPVSTVTLYFGVNKSTLSAEELAKLKSFYAKIKGMPGRIIVEGSSDSGKTKNTVVNMRVSMERSLSVIQALKKMGLSDKVELETKGFGDTKSAKISPTQTDGKLDRRVDVTFLSE